MTRRNFSRFGAHVKAHEAIINNEYWYGDDSPHLGKSFTAGKTAERHEDVIDVLCRAAKNAHGLGDRKLAREYSQLYEKLAGCRRHHRCGSQACPKCARAFQRAKVDAEKQLIDHLADRNSGTPHECIGDELDAVLTRFALRAAQHANEPFTVRDW
jgi:hypothetical protein